MKNKQNRRQNIPKKFDIKVLLIIKWIGGFVTLVISVSVRRKNLMKKDMLCD